jgi:hypothetical protein
MLAIPENQMRRPESDFPTIKHLRDRLTDLIENGLGDLPVQILVVPNSTIEAVARATAGPDYDPKKPALMIELEIVQGSRLPVSMISTEQMRGRGMATH